MNELSSCVVSADRKVFVVSTFACNVGAGVRVADLQKMGISGPFSTLGKWGWGFGGLWKWGWEGVGLGRIWVMD